jgi:hypothetical protein
MAASIMAYSISGSSEAASNSRLHTSALAQSRKRVETLLKWPNASRIGLAVRGLTSGSACLWVPNLPYLAGRTQRACFPA